MVRVEDVKLKDESHCRWMGSGRTGRGDKQVQDSALYTDTVVRVSLRPQAAHGGVQEHREGLRRVIGQDRRIAGHAKTAPQRTPRPLRRNGDSLPCLSSRSSREILRPDHGINHIQRPFARSRSHRSAWLTMSIRLPGFSPQYGQHGRPLGMAANLFREVFQPAGQGSAVRKTTGTPWYSWLPRK